MPSQGNSPTGFFLQDPIVCFHHLLTIPGRYESVSELLIGYVSIFMTRSHPQRPASEHSTGNQAFGWLFIAEPSHFPTLPSASLHSASNHSASNLSLLTYADAGGMLRMQGLDHSNKVATKCFG